MYIWVPSNSSFDFKPEVKVIDSNIPFTIDLSVADKLRELECLNDNRCSHFTTA